MKKIAYLLTLLGIIALGLSGCGGGGGGGAAAPTVVSGVASKGVVDKGVVSIYPIDNGVVGTTPLGTAETKVDGSYSITLSAAPTGPVMVEVIGGQFKDETTGTFGAKLFPLRAVVDKVTANAANSVAVTGLTEIAVQKIAGGGNVFNAATILEANNAVEAFFGIEDIIATNPADVTVAGSQGASTAAKDYGLALATLMQYGKLPGIGVTKAFEDFGKLLNAKLDPDNQATNETLTEGIIAKLFEARNTFLTDTTHNLSGVTGITSFTAADVRMRTQGTLPSGVKINGVELTLSMPAGVTVAAGADGTVDTSSASAPVKVSGLAATAGIKILAGAAKFTPATAATDTVPATPNRLKLVFVGDSAASFDLGEFVTITCNIAAGSRVTSSAFVISGVKAVTVGTDTSSIGAKIPGISITPIVSFR